MLSHGVYIICNIVAMVLVLSPKQNYHNNKHMQWLGSNRQQYYDSNIMGVYTLGIINFFEMFHKRLMSYCILMHS